MKIGFSVEDSTHQALLEGLRDRWYPKAILESSFHRGDKRPETKNEFKNTFSELFIGKGVDFLVILRDYPFESEWRKDKKRVWDNVPKDRQIVTIIGISCRNIEYWICADPNFIANELGNISPEDIDPKKHQEDNPDILKNKFIKVLGINRDDYKREEIAELVKNSDLKKWVKNSNSFKDFYEQVRDISQQKGCSIENLFDS